MPNSSLILPSGRTAAQVCTDIYDRRQESRKWMDANYREEWIEVWRSIKCRTKPMMKVGADGKETSVEDKSRTNVEMGMANLIYRKNVARLSANPYTLRVIGGQDPTVAPRFSSLLSQQYDRSGEQLEDVRVRMSGEALGIGISKIYWDYVFRQMRLRRALMKDGKFLFPNRTALMKHQGAPDDEIQGAVSEMGDDLQEQEIEAFLAKTGTETTITEEVPKYEGPCVKFRFPGDIGWQPFVKSLNDSSYITDSYQESDLWLKSKLKLTYPDPDTGEKIKAFDPAAVAALLEADPDTTTTKGEMQEMKDAFRQVSLKQTQEGYDFPRRLRIRKMYDIIEEHSQDDNGQMWITWIAENYRELPLGRMPYPCDFYGQSAYTDEVPLPDLIDSIGDSTPRLMRFVVSLYNVSQAQNFDYVTQTVRRLILAKSSANLSPETLQLGNFLVQFIDDLNGIKEFNLSPLPPGAFERSSQLLQQMGMFEPSLVQSDSVGNVVAGKTATASVLNAKAADSLLQFKISGRDAYLYWLGMKKIWMNQQLVDSDKPWTIDPEFATKGMGELMKGYGDQEGQEPLPDWATSDRMGKTTAIRLDPMEVQEDLEIEPEAGSYMSVDDQLKQDAAQKMATIAAQAPPGTVDIRKVVRFALSTIPDIGNPDDYILPEPEGPPPPPPPKISVSITAKMEDFPSIAEVVMKEFGVETPPEVENAKDLNELKMLSEAGDHASNLLTPEPDPEVTVGANGKPKPKIN